MEIVKLKTTKVKNEKNCNHLRLNIMSKLTRAWICKLEEESLEISMQSKEQRGINEEQVTSHKCGTPWSANIHTYGGSTGSRREQLILTHKHGCHRVLRPGSAPQPACLRLCPHLLPWRLLLPHRDSSLFPHFYWCCSCLYKCPFSFYPLEKIALWFSKEKKPTCDVHYKF